MSNKETHEFHGACIVGCGWRECDDLQNIHPGFCERTVGSKASAVTEPGFHRVQFWCAAIAPYLHGKVSRKESREAYKYRDGVHLIVNTWDDGPDYRETTYNMTSGEARQLAAQLVAAADSHDGINQGHFVLRRLEKLGKKVEADMFGQ